MLQLCTWLTVSTASQVLTFDSPDLVAEKPSPVHKHSIQKTLESVLGDGQDVVIAKENTSDHFVLNDDNHKAASFTQESKKQTVCRTQKTKASCSTAENCKWIKNEEKCVIVIGTAQYHELHLAESGAQECDYGISITEDECEAAAANLTPNNQTIGRTLRVGEGGECGDLSWGRVPLGCSVQSGLEGDWAAHFKRSSHNDGCASSLYQPVCAERAPGPRFDVVLGKTKLTGTDIDHGARKVKRVWSLPENKFILASADGNVFKMVEILVTGRTEFVWKQARKVNDVDCASGSSKVIDCFDHPDAEVLTRDNIDVELNAKSIHLAQPGAHKCDFGVPVAQNQCEAAARTLTPHNRLFEEGSLQVGEGESEGCNFQGWNRVPLGCSAKTESGVWKPHYRSGRGQYRDSCVSNDFRLVCEEEASKYDVILGGKTVLKGPGINGNLAATDAYRIEENRFIVAAIENSQLKMVKILVTGRHKFDVEQAKYSNDDDCIKGKTPLHVCFTRYGNHTLQTGAMIGYKVQLVAEINRETRIERRMDELEELMRRKLQ